MPSPSQMALLRRVLQIVETVRATPGNEPACDEIKAHLTPLIQPPAVPMPAREKVVADILSMISNNRMSLRAAISTYLDDPTNTPTLMAAKTRHTKEILPTVQTIRNWIKAATP